MLDSWSNDAPSQVTEEKAKLQRKNLFSFLFYYMATHHYGKRIGGFLGGGRKMSMGRKRNPHGDNPKIRHSHLEHKEINLNEEYEVRYAKEAGAIKIGRNGAVVPVRGKAYVKNGHLFYSDGRARRKSSRKKPRARGGRKITAGDRSIWGQEARKGTEKWHGMSHAERVRRRHHPEGNWGFNGKSPNTRDRR